MRRLGLTGLTLSAATAMVGGAVAALLIAPGASASPCVGVLNQSGCQPAPWNGQLMNTWDIPGSYGGWVNTPVACDPITTQCRMWAQP
ncbi:MAG: hypothetical protein WCH82_12575 [Mycobacteriaceae bacterium]